MTQPNTNCQVCNKTFYAAPWRIRLGRGKYCSSKCYGDRKRSNEGYIDHRGYKLWSYTHHPLANKAKHVYEHWLVKYAENPEFTLWAKKNKWTIHHKNGQKADNKKENLEWRIPGHHPKGWTLETMINIIRRAGYEVTKNT